MDIALLGMGACTAVGQDVASSAAAVRAGVSGFAQHRFVTDRVGEPVRVAAAPWLAPDWPVVRRMEALLCAAIDEALDAVRLKQVRLALAVGLPEARPGLPPLGPWLRATLAGRYQRVFMQTEGFEQGHAASLTALQAAVDGLRRGVADAWVVAGVDSYLCPATLAWLERCDQLQGAGPHNNAWGFVPGEAAAALLIVCTDLAPTLGRPSLARLLAVASGPEDARIKTRTVCTGKGLTQVLRATLPKDGERVTDLYNDMNGEPYRADEFGFALARTSAAFASPADVVTPADCTGDVGAASSALHIVLAGQAARKRYAAGRLALVHASSEGGTRAAALMRFD